MSGRTTGDKLHPADRAEVLRSFIYRMTTEAQAAFPKIAAAMKAQGWRMPERTDAEWLAVTTFAIRKDGRLNRRFKSCESR